ncbi:hypothetical protein [Rhizobium sp. P44RR-XXIV]|uniref:hypothetical protein n=1 Tax=Rhizobium sp. P44RR-XXIV TaxID=1921145 RepID=UPI0010AADE8E|nr:hypothetical protein [Rhizobium sp. P44RR-XXIV]TIX87691.1 hypothetical protein BSK43_033090 [Rhizobium sp. P44RR-XXIV]
MSEPPQVVIRIADVVTGLVLGALTGIIVGLTTASVVVTVLSSVLAIATAFVGLAGDTKLTAVTVNHARVASFAVAMIFTLLGGMWIRTHDLLSPNPKEIYDQLVTANVKPDDAADLVVFAKFGLLPKDKSAANSDPANVTKRIQSSLFADTPRWCDDFRRRQGQPVDDQIEWLAGQGGTYAELAARIKKLPDDRRTEVVHSSLFYICGFDS